MRSKQIPILIVALSLLFLCLGLVLSRSTVYLKDDERGVVISAIEPKGYRDAVLPPGLHWIYPYLESMKVYSIAKETYEFSENPPNPDPIPARTLDGNEVVLDAAVVYSIDPNKLLELHINWQDRYANELVRPAVRAIARDIISKYSAVDISLRRFEIELAITTELRKKFTENSLILHQFTILNVH